MKNTKTRVTGIVMFLLALFVAFIMIVPFVWMVSASFKLKKRFSACRSAGFQRHSIWITMRRSCRRSLSRAIF
ncbi:MAG: hypothetical protein ACLR6B_07470 [Blautia sp.]